MAQEVPEDPWVAWEAVEETEEASLQEGPEVPGGTPQEEEMSSTELETGSVPIRMYFSQQIDSVLVMTPYAQSGTGLGGEGGLSTLVASGGPLLPDCLQILVLCA